MRRDAPCPGRRAVLEILAGAAAGSLVMEVALLSGCASSPDAPASVSVPLDAVPVGARHVVKLGAIPVELHRTDTGIVARSLVCTHQGCIVAWQPDLGRYKCPCQGGWFDADGLPIAGPVTRPLPRFRASVERGVVTVTNPPEG